MKRHAETLSLYSIGVRVHAEKKQAIRRAAERQGLSLSDFTRQALTEAAQRVAA